MSNKLINVIKALYGFTKGSLSHLRDIKSDSIAYYKGDEEISKLIKQLNNQRSDYKNLLKKQINSEKKSVNLWEKKFSRRDFLKGLALTASMAKFSSKKL